MTTLKAYRIFNEDVSRVFEGLRVIYRSLQETKRLEHFDFFILSDSHDPNHWVAEEMAWLDLCKQVGGFGRIFYRKRRVRLHLEDPERIPTVDHQLR